MFRLSLLRPHLLAILGFCLPAARRCIRARPRLAALAAALLRAFLPRHRTWSRIVAVAAWLLRRQPGMHRHTWAWCLAGLGRRPGRQSLLPVQPRHGLPHAAASRSGSRRRRKSRRDRNRCRSPRVHARATRYAFLPLTPPRRASAPGWRRPGARARSARPCCCCSSSPRLHRCWSLKSMRAMEYAVPAGITAGRLRRARARASGAGCRLALVLLLARQAHARLPVLPRALAGAAADSATPHVRRRAGSTFRSSPGGYKVFNCEWETGSYILMARPDLRFVDLLGADDAVGRLANEVHGAWACCGRFADPKAILRGAFDADYVLCSNPLLIGRWTRCRRTSLRRRPGDGCGCSRSDADRSQSG